MEIISSFLCFTNLFLQQFFFYILILSFSFSSSLFISSDASNYGTTITFSPKLSFLKFREYNDWRHSFRVDDAVKNTPKEREREPDIFGRLGRVTFVVVTFENKLGKIEKEQKKKNKDFSFIRKL